MSQKERVAAKAGLAANHLAFVQNAGQWNRKATYRAQAKGLTYWVRNDGVTLDYRRLAKRNGKTGWAGQVIDMSFIGSRGATSQVGSDARAHTANYLSKGSGKMLKPKTYGELLSSGIYPGIDLRSYYQNKAIRYDFDVAPGANPNLIQLHFKGADKVVADLGELRLVTHVGTFAHGQLHAFQILNGKKVSVPAQFAMNGGNVGFKVGAYDHSKPLVIDPVLSALRTAMTQEVLPVNGVVYGSYYGGDDGWDCVTAVTADANGNVYMTGYTQATDFPITTGPYFTSLKGTQNAFVARLQGDAYNIDYSAYFGGSNSDFGQYISVDQYSNVWITGVTTSPDFPGNTKVNTGLNQPNIFLMRWETSVTQILDPVTNQRVLMLGYDGGAAATEYVNAFAIVPDPNPQQGDPVIFLMDGRSNKATPEVTTGTFASTKGFMLRYSFDGTNFNPVSTSCEYIGDGLNVDIGGLVVDPQGNVYVTGDVGDGVNNYDTSTQPNTFVTTPGSFTNSRLLQKNDLFARKYDPTGAIVYSVLIGGSGNEYIGGWDIDEQGNYMVTGNAIAIDSLGNAYITGQCNSFDYPRTRGAYGEIFDANQNIVVTKLTADASQIIYSTNLREVPGMTSSMVSGIALDTTGTAYVTGNLDVSGLAFAPIEPPFDPILYTPGGMQTGSALSNYVPVSTTYTTPMPPDLPTCEPWLNVLDPTASTLLYGTYLGGYLDDKVFGPYVDTFSGLWVNGFTDSRRQFIDPDNGNLVTDLGALPAGMITPKAFKATGDAMLGFTVVPNILWGLLGNGGLLYWELGSFFPPIDGEDRDGWLTKFSLAHPYITEVDVNPGTVPGGLGATATAGFALRPEAPIQGADVTLTLLTPQYQTTSYASFSPNGLVTTLVVHVPGLSVFNPNPIPIYTNPVTAPTQVLVRAYYQGNFMIAPLAVVPWLSNFTLTPNGVVGGNDITGTVVLAQPAPASGVNVTIQSDNQVVVAPASVNVPAGQTSASFTMTTSGVDVKTFPIITASLLGLGIADSAEIDPASITNLSLVPNRVSGWTDQTNSPTGTVTLNGLPGPNFPPLSVSVVGNPAGYVVQPTTLTFAAGSRQATFTVTVPYEPATITRVVQVQKTAPPNTDYTNQLFSSNLTVDPTPMINFTLDKSVANPGDVVNATVSLGSTADINGAVVDFSDGGSTAITLPNEILIPSGSTGATFAIPVGSNYVPNDVTVTITATRGPVSISHQLLVNHSTLTLTLSTGSVLGGNSLTGTIDLSDTARAGGESVAITFSPTGICSADPNPVIVTGTEGTFTINTIPLITTKDVTITATDGASSSSQVLEVRAPSVASISFTPSKVLGLHTSVCRISLDGPASGGGIVVALTNSNPRVANIPPSITIPKGKTSYQFTVFCKRVSRALTTTVTASAQGNSVSATLTAVRF